ncbi:MAG: hypothetical protein NUV76_05295 [Candidatus Kuenenia sp.]|nr:hypothetical protein [Candidatus Kuenenia sp.]
MLEDSCVFLDDITLIVGRNNSGKISNDDVIKFSSNIFGKYPKISRINASLYPYIFIDEYQNKEENFSSSKAVIGLLNQIRTN